MSLRPALLTPRPLTGYPKRSWLFAWALTSGMQVLAAHAACPAVAQCQCMHVLRCNKEVMRD